MAISLVNGLVVALLRIATLATMITVGGLGLVWSGARRGAI